MNSNLSPGTHEPARSESLAWSVRLSDDEPQKRWVVLACALLAGTAGLILMRSPLLGFLAFAIILGTTAEFWLGTRFEVGTKGASSRTALSLSRIGWDEVKRVKIEEETVLLSPLREATRLEPFRGVRLRTLPENREQVLEAIGRYVNEDVRLLEG